MWLGLSKSTEGLKNRNWGYLGENGICLKTVTEILPNISSLWTRHTDFNFANLHSCVSRFLKINVCIYMFKLVLFLCRNLTDASALRWHEACKMGRFCGNGRRLQFGEVIKEGLHREMAFQQKPETCESGSQAKTQREFSRLKESQGNDAEVELISRCLKNKDMGLMGLVRA